MLLAPFLSAGLATLQFLIGTIDGLMFLLPDVDTLQVPWPVPWVPHEPVLAGLTVGLSATVFPLLIKFFRWLYGMAPVVQ